MMTYMTYNLLHTLMTLIPILVWFGVSIWVAVDADRMPEEAWALSGESKNVWTAIAILLAWPFGLLFYIFTVRKKVATLARSINEDALITKATNRLRKEQDERNTRVPSAESQQPEVETTVSHQHADEVDQVETSNVESHNHKADEDAVFDYEESEASDDRYASGQVIPPKPDYAPTVGSDHSEESEDSGTKTIAYPVIPPKPSRAPRVDKDGTKG